MKILLLGHRGQVGLSIQSLYSPTHTLITPDIDITNDTLLYQTIIESAPDIIINAAAYTKVDDAEQNIDRAMAVNAVAPARIAQIAKENNIFLIHYSTDYVFDGTGHTPWTEEDTPNPLNVYGQSKWQGDKAIIESGCRHIIFRTSWVYGIRGDNFIKKILSLSQTQKELNIVCDQIGAPTPARFIAEATLRAIEKQCGQGVYHIAAAGETSWFDYACLVRDTHNSQCFMHPVFSRDYPQPAERPLNSRLNCNKFIKDFGMTLPDWKDNVILTTRAILKDSP